MEPIIRNVHDIFDGTRARLVTLDIHPWEHEVYIIEGSGTLICDEKEYPVKAGDAMFIPPNVDHYTLNNGGQGNIRRIEINPLSAARAGGAQNNGGKGTGQPPVIRHHSELNRAEGHVLISSKDGAPNYVMLHNNPMPPGAISNAATGGHTHAWEHVVFMLEGDAIFVCDGKEYKLKAGDAMLVPPNTMHQWKNESQAPVVRVTYNPVASETAEH